MSTPAAWDIDAVHSSIGFSVRHLVVSKVRGRFSRWTGSLLIDEREPSRSSVEVAIDAASIDTGNAERDQHLRSADFFEVAAHPEITFRSTQVESLGGERYRVSGDLTMHGIRRPVALEMEYGGAARDPWGSRRAGFTARASLERKDFGLRWNQALETGGVLVGDRVELEIEVEAVERATDAEGTAHAA